MRLGRIDGLGRAQRRRLGDATAPGLARIAAIEVQAALAPADWSLRRVEGCLPGLQLSEEVVDPWRPARACTCQVQWREQVLGNQQELAGQLYPSLCETRMTWCQRNAS